MATSRVAGALTYSSSSSGIFFQGDGQYQDVVNSHLGSSFGNSSNSNPTTGRPNPGSVSGDQNNSMLNSVANSGPSVGASSLVTDANSALSGGPHQQRSASINMESYMRLPASPLSFSSNNISASGSSVVDGSSSIQQGNHQDVTAQHAWQGPQLQKLGVSCAMSLPTSQNGQAALPIGQWVSSSDPNNISQAHKKPRLDTKQEDILRPILRRQDSVQLQGCNPQLQVLMQQQRLRQRQQILQSMPQLQRTQLQQQQQLQLRQQMQQQALQPVSAMKPPDGSICARRLMQYLYHQRQRPLDNSIAYWRKFSAEYYSPRAKKRWCLSLYDNVGHQALGVFAQATMDAWQCGICGSYSGRGFEATFDVLPRLNEIKFGSGVIDELLYLDLPREYRFASGIMLLEYGKAVQESVYEQLRVVHEGQLRIVFTQDLKILSWEFCARRHEEFFPRRFVALQLNQFLQVAQKCESMIAESGSDGVSQKDLETNSKTVLTAGLQLAKRMELKSLNDLGFSKRYVRCLQIAAVVNSMKDLIDYCREHKAGPIDGLKNYPRHASVANLQMQKMLEMEQLANVQGLPSDRNAVNKLTALHPGVNNHMNNDHHMVGRGALSGSAEDALALTNCKNLLTRQSSMRWDPNSLQLEASSSSNGTNQTPNFQGSMQNWPRSGHSSPHLPWQQSQSPLGGANNLPRQNHLPSSQGSEVSQQQRMIKQMLQETSGDNGAGVHQQSIVGHGTVKSEMGFENNDAAPSMSGGAVGPAPSHSSSFRAGSNSDSSPHGGGSNNEFNKLASDMPRVPHFPADTIDEGVSFEFSENDLLNCDLDYLAGIHN